MACCLPDTQVTQHCTHAKQKNTRNCRPQDASTLLKHGAAAEAAETACDRDSMYWVTKYMQQAAAGAGAAPDASLLGPEGGGLSPLAAVAAAKWRAALREKQAAARRAARDEEVEEADAKVMRG